jgi:two-component system, OmpR family, phosphate regulon sensor histidine kinase PhoR
MVKTAFLEEPVKRRRTFAYVMVIFILAQLAWLSLFFLWIYWYVSNYIIFSQVGGKLSAQMIAKATNVLILVGGILLLVAISVAMWMMFYRLSTQYNLTGLYDNFIANVTHELKSPLASIQLYLETMQKYRVSRGKQLEFLSMMLKDAMRLNNLINVILQIPALEQKKIAHNFSIYEADAIMRQLIREVCDQFQLTGTIVRIKGHAQCKCVLDPAAIKVVIVNLIDNGIKYSPNRFRMAIELGCDIKSFYMTFQDRGIGITAKEQKNIFKKFYRIYDKESPSVKGTGLGLYWVREIIRYHGGKISVFSEGKHKGTTFKILLPIYPTAKTRYIEKLIKLTQKHQLRKNSSEK